MFLKSTKQLIPNEFFISKTSFKMSAAIMTVRNMKILLTDINERLEKEGILQVRQTLDIWSKLMSYLLQGEYSQAIPIRRNLQDHMRARRHEKIHSFNSIIQRLDEVLDRYIPPPEMSETAGNSRPPEKAQKADKDKKRVMFEGNVVGQDFPDAKLSEEPVRGKNLLKNNIVIGDLNEIDRLKQQREESRKSINLLKANESVLMTTVEDQQQKIKNLESAVAVLEKQNAVLKGDFVSLAGEKDDDRISVCSKAETEIKFLRKELKIKEQALELSLIERNKLLEKLSSVTSFRSKSRATSGGRDFDDVHRPTKLAERFSELHDGEWTDALHLLTLDQGLDDRTAIQWLLDVLFDSYVFCEQTSESHTQLLIEDMLFPFRRPGEMQQIMSSQFDSIPMELICELKKSAAKSSLAHVKEKFRMAIKQSYKKVYDQSISTMLRQYMDRCVEVCWYMVLHSPPMCLDTTTYKGGEELDRDVYRFYTTSGSKIDFIVWPALYLSRKGIVLSQGVAQPKPEGVALRISTTSKKRF